MKRNKILMPFVGLTMVGASIIPLVTSCNQNNSNKIYLAGSNYRVINFNTMPYKYVSFELSVNIPANFTYKSEESELFDYVTNMPMIEEIKTIQHSDSVNVLTENTLCIPEEGTKYVHIYVPFELVDGETLNEEDFFSVSIKFGFYDGTYEEYAQNKMHKTSSPSCKVSPLKAIHSSVDEPVTILTNKQVTLASGETSNDFGIRLATAADLGQIYVHLVSPTGSESGVSAKLGTYIAPSIGTTDFTVPVSITGATKGGESVTFGLRFYKINTNKEMIWSATINNFKLTYTK